MANMFLTSPPITLVIWEHKNINCKQIDVLMLEKLRGEKKYNGR